MGASCSVWQKWRPAMPSTNGHGPKRAILYARVSTDEQARTGYSLAQQLEALRAHAAREGYEILEEVTDAGYSGASLERPGMDRLIEQEAAWRADGPDRETEILLGKVSECACLRAAYQDQQAAGLMTMEELAEKLEELEAVRTMAQTELANLSERRRRVEELVRDKDAVLALRSEAVVRGLEGLSPEEKSEVYRLLKLELTPTPEGILATGALLCSETLSLEKASRVRLLSEASSGLSQNFASPTTNALSRSNSSVSVLSLFPSREAASR